ITVSNSYTGYNEVALSAVLFNNVSQTNPFGTNILDVAASARTTESETTTTTTGDLAVHVIADGLVTRGTLGAGETSRSVANDGNDDASLWVSTKPGGAPTTTVSSAGWASGVVNGVGIVVHGSGPAAPAAPTIS